MKIEILFFRSVLNYKKRKAGSVYIETASFIMLIREKWTHINRFSLPLMQRVPLK